MRLHSHSVTKHTDTNAQTHKTIGNVVSLVNVWTELEHNARVLARFQQTFHHLPIILHAQDLQPRQLIRLLATLL